MRSATPKAGSPVITQNGPNSRVLEGTGHLIPLRGETGQKQGASGPDAPIPERPGWRVEVDLVNQRWRYARGSKRARQWTPYQPLDTVPSGTARIERARAESARQRRLKVSKR